jgi:predicted nucleic acid-binding Zn ribbon protein
MERELMARYGYRCPRCGNELTIRLPIEDYDPSLPVLCTRCGDTCRRTYQPLPFRLPTEGHWNQSVGRYVSGDREFRDELRRASDAATERTGIPHDYKPIDPRDTEALGVTGEGLGETQKRRQDEGKPLLDLSGLDL